MAVVIPPQSHYPSELVASYSHSDVMIIGGIVSGNQTGDDKASYRTTPSPGQTLLDSHSGVSTLSPKLPLP